MITNVKFSKFLNLMYIKITIAKCFEFFYVFSIKIPDVSLCECWKFQYV